MQGGQRIITIRILPALLWLAALAVSLLSITSKASAAEEACGITRPCPKKVIVRYEYLRKGLARVRGRRAHLSQADAAQAIADKFGVRLSRTLSRKGFVPVFGGLLQTMRTENVLEGEALSNSLRSTLQQRMAALAEPRRNALAHLLTNSVDRGFSRTIELHLRSDHDVEKLVNTAGVHPRVNKNLRIISVDPTEESEITEEQLPNDPHAAEQWALQHVTARAADQMADVGNVVIVAVIDTGVEITHPDLHNRIAINAAEIPGNGIDDDHNGYIDDVNGWDFVADSSVACPAGVDCTTPDNDPTDLQGHGTHVAGIIAAETNNGIGVAGICPNCQILPLRAGHTKLPDTAIIDAIYYAITQGADIINFSFGKNTPLSPAYRHALALAREADVVLIGGAGNIESGVSPTALFYPAAEEGVLSVANTDAQDNLSPTSRYGAWIDMAAPGSSILSTGLGGTYVLKSGTSMSAPQVAGVAGIMRALAPRASAEEVQRAIIDSATPLPNLVSQFSSNIGILSVENGIYAAAFRFSRGCEINGVTYDILDLDHNGVIDNDDVLSHHNFGSQEPNQPATCEQGDLNGDGRYNVIDFNMFLSGWILRFYPHILPPNFTKFLPVR